MCIRDSIYPISRIFIGSIYDFDTGVFSLAAFQKFFSKSYYTNTIINSAKVTTTVTLLTVIFGSALAYITRTVKIRFKGALDIAMIISVPVSYTHLDVYKRQGHDRIDHDPGRSQDTTDPADL